MLFQCRDGGVVVTGSDAEFERARSEFEAGHLVHLPGILSPDVAERVRRGIEREGFLETGPQILGRPAGPAMGAYQGTTLAQDLKPGEISLLFAALDADPELLGALERIAGCPPLRGLGRVFRILPMGVDLPWHTDTEEGRILDLAIGLTWERPEGGRFQMRDAQTEIVFNEVGALAPGDGILIRLSPEIEHHFRAVRGSVPLAIYSGKFAPRQS